MRQSPNVQSKAEKLKKLMRYCAYQERCHQEVRNKLLELGARGEELEEIIAELIKENFLNEERFAKAFASGKFRIKKWGRNKIERALENKGISQYCIRKGLKEIDPDEYPKALESIVRTKLEKTKAENIYEKRDKVAKFAITKGYEPELVWEILKKNT